MEFYYFIKDNCAESTKGKALVEAVASERQIRLVTIDARDSQAGPLLSAFEITYVPTLVIVHKKRKAAEFVPPELFSAKKLNNAVERINAQP